MPSRPKIIEPMPDATGIGITGGRGILGREVVKAARAEGIEADLFPGDITSAPAVSAWLEDREFDAILHLAAVVPVSEVEAEPERATEVNVGGTRLLLDTLRSLEKSPWLFYASTSHVYRPSDTPIKEDAPLKPVSTYGKIKLEGEQACLADGVVLPVCIGRIFSYFHPEQKKPFLFPSLRERLENEDLTKPFTLQGAKSTRDFLTGKEVAEIILGLWRRKLTGTFNIASGKATTIADFTQSLTPQKLQIVHQGVINHLVADVTKLQEALSA